MTVDELKQMLMTNIKKNYLYDLYYEEGKELGIEDIIDMPDDLKTYMDEHVEFKNNVLVLLKKVSELINNDLPSNYAGQEKVEKWYRDTINKFGDIYREFAIACTGNMISNDDIYQISAKEKILDVIESTYEVINKKEKKKVTVR